MDREVAELYRQIAKDELREDDAIRERSLTEMRQWIANNRHIRKCRTDAKFLLRFLRLRQFSVPMACEALERYLALRELYPGWYKNLDCKEASMKEIFKNGPFSYLGQDGLGRAVVLVRFGRFDDQKFRPVQDGRFMALFMETLLEIEEVQIGGCQVFVDYAGCTVELYRQIAKDELREDDAVRERSLTEMRQWIANNPHIRKCRTDAKFLLRFLRLRQFSVPMACEALERYLAMRELYPGWYKNLDCNDAAMKEIFNNGPMVYLGQDGMGRSVILIQFKCFDGHKFQPVQDGRCAALVMETMLEYEEVQIGGYQVLIDYGSSTKANYDKWGATDLKIIMDAFSRSYPNRYGEIHAAMLPKFGVPMVNTFLSFANPKMREKINCHSTIGELEKLFETTQKPISYGGSVDLDEMNRALWKRVEDQRDVILGLDEMEIDVDYYASLWDQEEPSSEFAGIVLKQLE
ncbi:retinaldehyde-binding protein 1-like [Anopheles darlingi]|uniref:retinaldehyde-binding protein 1-like n=1 Tax=Anopheles darlingi TaxID=43151 RepID=UPI0021005E05|nr:retinaldehyde-binding protein 1-like [Anopheles darlingi]